MQIFISVVLFCGYTLFIVSKVSVNHYELTYYIIAALRIQSWIDSAIQFKVLITSGVRGPA